MSRGLLAGLAPIVAVVALAAMPAAAQAEPPPVMTEPAQEITRTSASLRATVNPNGRAVSECYFEYGTTPAYGKSVSCTPYSLGSGTSPVAVSGSATGLTANTNYHFRIVARNPSGTGYGADQGFTTESIPTVETFPASDIRLSSATLNATVNSNNDELTDCNFEWGTTTSYGEKASCHSEEEFAVSSAIAGLVPDTTYHFRISATNAAGTSKGSDEMFTTSRPAYYYRNGVLIPEGLKVPILAWGKLTWEPEPKIGGTTCADVAGGYVENSEGGGGGIGAIEDFVTYDCENNECPAGTIEIGGKPEEKVFDFSTPPQNFPWPTSLIEEPEARKFRTDISDMVMQAGCYATPLTRAEAEQGKTTGPGESELLPLATTVTCVTTSEHELQPLDENGTSASSPSKLVFDSKAGTLSCAGNAFAGKPLKSLKIIGYNGSELITVKDP